MNLDDRKWEPFFITDIFPKKYIKRGKRLTKNNHSKGNTPYISSTAMNNGVDNFIEASDKMRVYKKCLSVANSGSVGSSFYEPFEFVASDHVTHLENSDFDEYVYLFIATMTSRWSEKYNFNREINDKRISREIILLPVNDSGDPDYDFMRAYIKDIFSKQSNNGVSFIKKISESLQYVKIPNLNEKKWGKFTINYIFKILSGKRLEKHNMTSGDRPFIGSTDSNNGITNFISNTNSSLDKNVLGVNYNGSVVENFYHPYECIFSDDVKRLHLRHYPDNEFVLLFFKTIILQQKQKYMYAYKFNGNRMKRQYIMVPVNSECNPDYEYMEQYMKNMMWVQCKKYLDCTN